MKKSSNTAMTDFVRHVVLINLGIWVTGCAQIEVWNDKSNQLESKEQLTRVDVHSSFPAINRVDFEHVHFLEMVDPKGEALLGIGGNIKSDGQRPNAYELTFSWFRDTKSLSAEQKRSIRNSVQDRIISVATSRCNVYKTYLRRRQADGNFAFGSLTTVAGVLGAIVPSADAAKTLAGAAGLFSGLQAEFNQAYYSNLTAHVITSGIDLKQSQLRQLLYPGARNQSVIEYTLPAAISDAIYYDGTCSALTGLVVAQESIKEVGSPGLRTAFNAIVQARTVREVETAPLSSLTTEKIATLSQLGANELSPLIATLAKRSPSTMEMILEFDVLRAAKALEFVEQSLETEAKFLENFLTELKKKSADEKKEAGTLTPELLGSAYKEWAQKNVVSILKAPAGAMGSCLYSLQKNATQAAEAYVKLSMLNSNDADFLKIQGQLNVLQGAVHLGVSRIDYMTDEAVRALSAARQLITAELKAPINHMPEKLKKLPELSSMDEWKCSW